MVVCPIVVLVLIASTNAVNITDGLDGLAAGVTLIVTVFFTIVAMTRSEWEYIKCFRPWLPEDVWVFDI